MRILITTGIFPPDIGGPATYVPQIASGLSERGHQVKVLTTDKNRGSLQRRRTVPLFSLSHEPEDVTLVSSVLLHPAHSPPWAGRRRDLRQWCIPGDCAGQSLVAEASGDKDSRR